ncbi:MAG TPA: response regulator transcription factor [Pyrinomonadaceae bacterium]|jgi:Response regulator containing a CheY-like receiver domain and an HTH DNA-binding domain|nr:response regulator transcription factor [Pyrinomonadaceae bacterium]
MKRTTILIADDHKMFAEGLASLLEEEFELVGIVENGKALIEAATRLEPEVIVVDISMPILNGFDAVRRLKQSGTTAKVIFLTMHADSRLLAEAIRCGAVGYVLKQSAGEDLVHAIRQVIAGHNYVTQDVQSEWQTSLAPHENEKHLNLTPRQREVLQLLSAGLTMKEIASRLGISTRTAESHKYEMMEGLGVGSTAELVQYAIKLGITRT